VRFPPAPARHALALAPVAELAGPGVVGDVVRPPSAGLPRHARQAIVRVVGPQSRRDDVLYLKLADRGQQAVLAGIARA